jgi:hypothetical protein
MPTLIQVGDAAPVFRVLMKNTSGRPLLIWKQWCSFGYFNLHYQVTRSNGQKFDLRRRGGSWTWNFPDGKNVLPGEVITFDGTFDPGNSNSGWGGFPADWKDGEKVQLRAIYENGHDPVELKVLAALEHADPSKHYLQAWTGTVVSVPIVVALD